MATSDSADSDHNQSDRRIFDVVLAGQENVGKTSIYLRVEKNTFEENISTLGVDNFEREYQLKSGEQVRVRLWDTGGSERHRAMTRSYYKNAKAVIFVYSTDISPSLSGLNFWIDDASGYAPKDALWVFVCNKIDLEGDDVQLSDADEAAFFDSQLELLKGKDGRPPSLRCRTSAKTGEGINAALEEILHRIVVNEAAKEGGDQEETGNPLLPPIKLEAEPPPEKKPCPC